MLLSEVNPACYLLCRYALENHFFDTLITIYCDMSFCTCNASGSLLASRFQLSLTCFAHHLPVQSRVISLPQHVLFSCSQTNKSMNQCGLLPQHIFPPGNKNERILEDRPLVPSVPPLLLLMLPVRMVLVLVTMEKAA